MWHIVKVWRGIGHVEKRAQRDARQRQRGFSHPARFEALEERLALNVGPGTPSVVSADASGVSGDTGSTAGTNPANFSPANTTGSIAAMDGNVLNNQEVAFNTPYWVPNDRPPFTPPPPGQLPAGVNQAASTPQGIHNFGFGPDTSTHFSMPGVVLTVRRPTNANMAEDRVLDSLEDTLLADAEWRVEALLSHSNEAAEGAPLSEVPLPVAERDSLIGEPSPTSEPELFAERSDGAAQLEPVQLAPVHLEQKAVDRMMADGGAAEVASADLAIAQVVAENTGEPGEGCVLYALAASLSLATAVPIREHVWNKTDAARKGRRHRAW